jgi:hypothetical protein
MPKSNNNNKRKLVKARMENNDDGKIHPKMLLIHFQSLRLSC